MPALSLDWRAGEGPLPIVSAMSCHPWVTLTPEIIIALSPVTVSRQISGPTCPYSTLSADFCQPGAKSGGVYKSVGNCLRPTCACAAPMIRGGWGQAAFVIPAQAGIQPCEGSGWVTAHAWTPAYAGVTALLASPQRIPTEIDTEPQELWASPSLRALHILSSLLSCGAPHRASQRKPKPLPAGQRPNRFRCSVPP